MGTTVALLSGCFDDASGRIEVESDECVVCHIGDYLSARNPQHADVYPMVCIECHGTTSWRPATGGLHPEAAFAVETGHHIDIECAQCHDSERGSAANGTNTDCINCHAGAHPRSETDPIHLGIVGYPLGEAPVNFCLSCHPDGTADASLHPEVDFPVETGQHTDIACDECHNRTLGSSVRGANTDCINCHAGAHPRTETDPIHQGIDGYPPGEAPVNFCLSCHPRGTADALLHPEATFAVETGPHADVACDSCHDRTLGSNIDGANTDCIHCHTGEHPRSETDPLHAGVGGYPDGTAPVNFCLTCHPDGTADSMTHPESVFPIADGPHSEFDCAHCHDAALGINSRDNTDCVGCHTGQHSNEDSRGVHREGRNGILFREYEATEGPNFCLECHPSGTRG